MKTLFLLRHARALEKLSGQKDIERELAAVGLQNATRMGIYLKQQQIKFDIIISSPAERAKTTALLIAEQIKYDTSKIHFNEEIYEASARTLLQVVNQLKNEWSKVLIVGHNPSVSYLAEYVTTQEVGNVTTCGLVEINFDTKSWADISEGTGDMISYQHPENLNF